MSIQESQYNTHQSTLPVKIYPRISFFICKRQNLLLFVEGGIFIWELCFSNCKVYFRTDFFHCAEYVNYLQKAKYYFGSCVFPLAKFLYSLQRLFFMWSKFATCSSVVFRRPDCAWRRSDAAILARTALVLTWSAHVGLTECPHDAACLQNLHTHTPKINLFSSTRKYDETNTALSIEGNTASSIDGAFSTINKQTK